MKFQYNLSSANVFIEMPSGHPVGYITDLNINTNMNQQQIKNLRSEGIQSYVKGFTVNNITASRAIIDGETFFGNYKNILDYITQITNIVKTLKNQTKVFSPLGNEGSSLIDFIYDSGLIDGNNIDYRELIDSFEKFTKKQINMAEFWAKIPFSIVAKTSIPDYISNEILDTILPSEIKELWRLDNCFLNSRSIKLSTSDVIILENLEIFSKTFIDQNLIEQIINS